MTDPKTNSEDPLRKLSRRNWLRDSAITATGVALLPSFFTGCTKEAWNYIHDHGGHGGGVGEDPPITEAELAAAAKNLHNIQHWVEELYVYTGKYEEIVFDLLKSGSEGPKSWGEFILNIFITISTRILEEAVKEVPGLGPAIALAGDSVKEWATGDKPRNLLSEFPLFKNGHLEMQIALVNMLERLQGTDDDGNYKNLRDRWPGEIEFNGKKYTLRELANAKIPTEGDDYVNSKTAAYDQFRKHLWNLMFIKCGTMIESDYWTIGPADLPKPPGYLEGLPTEYGRAVHYKDYPATYLRGKWATTDFHYWLFKYWWWEFDGLELSEAAAELLFNDDTPEHIINNDALFTREYVFKQFHLEKPDFKGYHELRKDLQDGPLGERDNCYNFDCPDNWEFTGGEFPMLTH